MDYVPAHGNTNAKDDRQNIGGCRAFDGEDQGKSPVPAHLLSWESDAFRIFINCNFFLLLGYGNRLRMQQLQQTDWTNQQIREKELYKEQERARDDAFYQ